MDERIYPEQMERLILHLLDLYQEHEKHVVTEDLIARSDEIDGEPMMFGDAVVTPQMLNAALLPVGVPPWVIHRRFLLGALHRVQNNIETPPVPQWMIGELDGVTPKGVLSTQIDAYSDDEWLAYINTYSIPPKEKRAAEREPDPILWDMHF
jgi:hypothetical protein